jgi:two-component system nitrogen regulation sensor histidine kinase GlnL
MQIDGPRLRLEHVSVEVAPLDDPNGSVVISMRDRGLEHRMARQGAAAEAAQSVRSMAGMLAHEIKNPLAGIPRRPRSCWNPSSRRRMRRSPR